MRQIKNKYFIKKISDDSYLCYNTVKNIPVKLSTKGMDYFNALIDSEMVVESVINMLTLKEKNEFLFFYESLDNVNFFDYTDEVFANERGLPKVTLEKSRTFYLGLTNRCNLSCTYCFNRHARNMKKDLSLKQWKAIIDSISEYTKKVILTGGEPTLYSHLKELISYIYSKDILIEFISNGNTVFEDKLSKDIIKKISSIKLSCDSFSSREQERVGFNEDIFKQNIKYIESIGYIDRVNITSVWIKGGERELNEVEKFCNQKGCSFNRALYIPRTKEDASNLPALCDYADYIRKPKAGTSSDSHRWGDVVISCGAAFSVFSVDANGDCYPCQSFHYKDFLLGNLLVRNFVEIYNSAISSLIRAASNINNKQICNKCNFKYLCSGGCMAATYNLEGSIFRFPETLCSYYKESTIHQLEAVIKSE